MKCLVIRTPAQSRSRSRGPPQKSHVPFLRQQERKRPRFHSKRCVRAILKRVSLNTRKRVGYVVRGGGAGRGECRTRRFPMCALCAASVPPLRASVAVTAAHKFRFRRRIIVFDLVLRSARPWRQTPTTLSNKLLVQREVTTLRLTNDRLVRNKTTNLRRLRSLRRPSPTGFAERTTTIRPQRAVYVYEHRETNISIIIIMIMIIVRNTRRYRTPG